MKSILTFLLAICSFYLSAQVYANDELRIQAEKHTQNKVKALKTNESVSGIIQEKEKKPINIKEWNNSYVLTKIEAVDYNNKHTDNEMLVFNEESKAEFDKTEIRVSNNFDFIYFKSKLDESNYSIKKIYVENQNIKYLDCEKCQDAFFQIIEKTENYLVLETKAQDEGSFYTTRLILKK